MNAIVATRSEKSRRKSALPASAAPTHHAREWRCISTGRCSQTWSNHRSALDSGRKNLSWMFGDAHHGRAPCSKNARRTESSTKL
jgi:hypothetical protein